MVHRWMFNSQQQIKLSHYNQKSAYKRIEEVSGVFPGHGTIDLHPKTLQYIMDTANRIIAHPDWYDTKVDFFGTEMYAKFIYQQGSDLKYTKEAVIKE